LENFPGKIARKKISQKNNKFPPTQNGIFKFFHQIQIQKIFKKKLSLGTKVQQKMDENLSGKVWKYSQFF
jgi:hypothetical protein